MKSSLVEGPVSIQCSRGVILRYDVDGRTSPDGSIRYIGEATRQDDGSWRCLADVDGMLCLVQISLRGIYES